MNEQAYDISYLLDSDAELVRDDSSKPQAANLANTVPSAVESTSAQDLLISELAQFSSAHEELIQQYLRVTPNLAA